MSLLQGIILALLQGVTELFPVSSLGHAVLAPAVLGWNIDESDPAFLPFLVALHGGTAGALLIYFRKEWIGLTSAAFGVAETMASDRKLLLMLVVGTLPAAAVGIAFEHALRAAFASPLLAAVFLIVNGVVLYTAERLKRSERTTRTLATMTYGDAALIGLAQAAALIPGISRSGVTMVGGLWRGLSHADAARFSFLLATPVIIGATVLEVPKLLWHRVGGVGISIMIIAAIVAGITAYLSTAFLMKYFSRHEADALVPYALYCVLAGTVCLTVLL